MRITSATVGAVLGAFALSIGMTSQLPLTSSSGPGTAAQVAAAVKASTSIRAVPADLTPSLSDFTNPNASQSLSGTSMFSKCDPYNHPKQVEDPVPCFLADTNASETLVLTGDSNAGNWIPALIPGLTKAHVRLAVLAYASCPTPDLTYTSKTGGVQWQSCNTWHEKVPAVIQSLDPVALIAVSGAVDLHLVPSAQWIAGFKKLFKVETNGLPKTVRILFGTSPIFNESVPTCVIAESDPQSCDLHFTVGQGTYGEFVARDPTIAKAANANFVPVVQWFCTSGTCSPIVSKYLVYVDIDHVSIAYSNYLSDVTFAAIHNLL